MVRAIIPKSIHIAEAIESAPSILGAPSQLHQVFVNIMVNASDAVGGSSGTITVGGPW